MLNSGIPSWIQLTAHLLLVGDADKRQALRDSVQVALVGFPSESLILSDSERLAREQILKDMPGAVGLEPYYRACVELGKSKTVVTTEVIAFRPPASPIASEAMETGASGTLIVSLIEMPTIDEGAPTRPTSAMQVGSSD